MKKLLFLFTLISLFSCSEFSPEADTPLYIEKYSNAFKESFGIDSISSEQTWGFYIPQKTRTVVKPDMTNYPTENLPADVTEAEAKYVQEWFENNPGLSKEGLDISNFFIQYVSSKPGQKEGIWHRYDQNPVPDGTYWDETFTDDAGMDFLVISDGKDYVEHVSDFNNYGKGSFGIVYIENGSALQWGYQSSWDTDKGIYYYFKLAEIDVPGVGKGWYIGLSVYGKKYDNGEKEIGYQRLDYAEDWIFKLIPAEPIKEQLGPCRVICEDLVTTINGSIVHIPSSDWDYNDLIFDAEIKNGKVYVTIQCLGGTLPIYIKGYNKELHEELGVPVSQMLYVNDPNKDENGNYVGLNHTIEFVDSEITCIHDIKVYVYKDNLNHELYAIKGQAPAKICVGLDFKWCNERQNIKDVYPIFGDWVQHPEGFNWDNWYNK